jgi:hypothetical protein
MRDLTDTEQDAIWDQARSDAIDGTPNAERYQDAAERAFYSHAYRMNYARQNGY